MVCKECGIAIAALLAGFVYVFYTPLPDGAVEPWKQLLARSLVRVVDIMTNIGETFGYTRLDIYRALSDGGGGMPHDESIDITDTKFEGVDVRIYKPQNAQDNGPGLVYIHGGGWQFGSIQLDDPFVRKISKSSHFVTISIGYRRAPENPFPVPFDDCLAATTHFIKNAKQYGVDSTRIGIVGDSAGGNLAAAVTLKLSIDKDMGVKPRLQTLILPALQASDFDLPSYRTYNDVSSFYILTKQATVKYWLNYGRGNSDFISDFLANSHTSPEIKKSKYFKYIDRKQLPKKFLSEVDKSPKWSTGNEKVFDQVSKWLLNPYFAPLMASDEDLSTLPATYILTAEYDPLRDDGYLFVKRLQSLQIEVLHTHYDGLGHAFVGFDFLESTQSAIDDMVQFWNSQMFDEEELLKVMTKKT